MCDTLNRLCGRISVGGSWYWAGGRRVELAADPERVLIRRTAAPVARLPYVLGLDARRGLARRSLAIGYVGRVGPHVHKALVAHPAVEAVYPVWRDAAGRAVLTTDRIVAGLRPGVDVKALGEATGVRVLRPVRGLSDAWLFIAAADDPLAASRRLVEDPRVRWAHPDFLRRRALHRLPDDPMFAEQWHHLCEGQEGAAEGVDLRSTEAWDLVFGEPSVRIGVFDDGVDWRHPDLTVAERDDGEALVITPPERLRRALDDGCCQHGTAVAGVAAATGDNGAGVAGACPGCSVVPMFTEPGWDQSSVMAESMLEAMAADVAVINNSWGPFDGLPGFDEGASPREVPLDDVQDEALRTLHDDGREGRGTVVVFSAGNGNEDTADNGLATHPTVIGVGALDDTGHKAFYSDFGEGVWVVAPSDGGRTLGIRTTDARGDDWGFNRAGAAGGIGDRDGDYLHVFGGTSAAAPAVSGVVGLMLSANPELTAAEVKDILRRTARPVDRGHGRYVEDDDGFLRSPYYGYGLVDARAAVEMAAGGEPAPGPRPSLRTTVPPPDLGADCQPDRGCFDPQQACLARVDRWGEVIEGEHGCVDGGDDGCLAFCEGAWEGQPAMVQGVLRCMQAADDCGQAQACFP